MTRRQVSVGYGDPSWTASTDDGSADLSAQLIHHREAAGLTQEDLAHASGLSVRAISDLERGRTRRPHHRSVALLVSALRLDEVSAARLFRARRPERGRAVLRSMTPTGDTLRPAPGTEGVVPRQLPMEPCHFAGRVEELAVLSGLLRDNPGRPTVAAIGGPAGIGKTALAVHWARQVAHCFPDGQLYVDLRRLGGSGDATGLRAVLRGVLEAFALPPERIPVGVDDLVALYRSLLAGRRVLVLLDNARDADQVYPLLPGSPGCLVVVTSRRELTGLVAAHGAWPVTLGPLRTDEARELLVRMLGVARVAAEPVAIRTLIERSGRMPLTLSVSAARAAVRPELPLAAFTPAVAGMRAARRVRHRARNVNELADLIV